VKRFHRLASSALVASMAFAGMAGAQAQTRMSGSGFSMYSPGSSYIGLNVGQTDYSLGNGTNVFPSDQKDTAYGINAGSYFHPNFGLEVGYTDFGKADRGGGDTKAMGFNVSLIGRLPLGSQFNLLGKVGTTYGRTEVSSRPGSGITAGKEDGFGLSYGIGAEYSFTPQVSGVVQYDEHDLKFAGNGRDRISATTVGLRYRF
jgi:OmpA-OmpF porin, OOP family